MQKLNVLQFIKSCNEEARKGRAQSAFDRLFEVLTDTNHQSDDWEHVRDALQELRKTYHVG